MKRDTDGAVFAIALTRGAVCSLCGLGPDGDDPFEVDHRKPKNAGGQTEWDNLQLVHESCNKIKSTRAVV